MPSLIAAMISLGILGAIDTYLTATILPIPVWVTFIAWASFFVCGGGKDGFITSVARNWMGIVIASLTLLVIGMAPAHPAIAAVCVGLGTSAMVAAASIPLLAFTPAIVFGFASLVGTTAATGKSVMTGDLSHPTIVAAVAMLVGASFGYASELLTNMLAAKKPVTA
jgi:hypothetical protein